ncbi:glycosyltransferase family 2 protein [Patescibacteria group bacterium]|nr:glycosyltransferase family 2 protein [Patescibacteria group bacterium]
MAKKSFQISVVIPVYNEQKSLEKLHQELVLALSKIGKTYEIIFIDDGSFDKSAEVIKKIVKNDRRVKSITFRKNYGKGAALSAGFEFARSEIIVTMDSDLQDDPKEIRLLLNKLEEGYDVVSGWKKERQNQDSFSIVALSYFSNLVVSLIAGFRIHDMNCGLKVYKKEVVDTIDIRGDLFRLIPLMAHQKGFGVAEVPVAHRKRRWGESNYNVKKMIGGIVDLLTVVFLNKFSNRPAHFFGVLGFTLFLSGFFVNFYITCLKIATGTIQGHLPLLIFGVLMLILGVQFVSIGFLAELIISKNKKVEYLPRDTIGF